MRSGGGGGPQTDSGTRDAANLGAVGQGCQSDERNLGEKVEELSLILYSMTMINKHDNI